MSERAAMQKAALVSALDSSTNVVFETRELLRKQPEIFHIGDRIRLSNVLEQMGRLCFSVSEECCKGTGFQRKKGA